MKEGSYAYSLSMDGILHLHKDPSHPLKQPKFNRFWNLKKKSKLQKIYDNFL
jgi:hypothetical protein